MWHIFVASANIVDMTEMLSVFMSQINKYIAPHFVKLFSRIIQLYLYIYIYISIYIFTQVINICQSSSKNKNYSVIPFNNHGVGLSVLKYPI